MFRLKKVKGILKDKINLKFLLLILLFIFSLLSLISFFYIIYDGIFIQNLKFDLSSIEYFKNFLYLFKDFKILYVPTISLITIYVAFQRVDIAQLANENTLQQIQITTKEISNKAENEIKYNSIEQCNYFYNVLQPSIVEMFEKIKIKRPMWSVYYGWEIKDFTFDDIQNQNRPWIAEFNLLNNDSKSSIALTINKLEIFSLNIMEGKIDQNFIYNAIGPMYKEQIKILYPFISLLRDRNIEKTDNFMNKCVELYNLWRDKLEQ